MPNFRMGNFGDFSFPASRSEGLADFELNNLDSRLEYLGDLGGTIGADTETCEAARSVKGLVYWLSGDGASESESLTEATLMPAAFCASCSITAAYNLSISSSALCRSDATTDSSTVTILPLIEGCEGRDALGMLPQEVKAVDLFGLGRFCVIGVIGLGSMLTEGLTGFSISICSEYWDD